MGKATISVPIHIDASPAMLAFSRAEADVMRLRIAQLEQEVKTLRDGLQDAAHTIAYAVAHWGEDREHYYVIRDAGRITDALLAPTAPANAETACRTGNATDDARDDDEANEKSLQICTTVDPRPSPISTAAKLEGQKS